MDILNVANGISAAWYEVELLTIVELWHTLLDHKASNEWNSKNAKEKDHQENVTF